MCEICMCLARAVWEVSVGEDWFWSLPILWKDEECLMCVSLLVVVMCGTWARVCKGGWWFVSVRCDSGLLCRWQVQVSVYCAMRIPAHLRCTQCSIL